MLRRSYRRSEDFALESLWGVIAGHAEAVPGMAAMVADDGAEIPYENLVSRMEATARALRAMGLDASSRIGVVAPATLDGIAAAVAVAASATAAPLNPGLTPAELAKTAIWLQLDAIVAIESMADLAVAAVSSLGVPVLAIGAGGVDPPDWRGPKVARRPRQPRARTDVALLLRSSGTTGPEKLIPVTHGNLLAMARKMAAWLGVGPADRSACLLPPHYAAGLKQTVLVPLLLGGSVGVPVLACREKLSDWASKLNPTWLSTNPTLLQAMVEAMEAGDASAPGGVRFVLCGASHLPEPLRRRAQARLDVPLLQCYGLSEAGLMACNRPSPGEHKPGSVGRIDPAEVAILDSRGRPAPSGQSGEIGVRGPSVTPGYDDGTGGSLRSGWLGTGDLGRVDEDGFLIVLSRLREVINRGGEKISPHEIEAVLLEHPDVVEAAAFAVPHPRLGQDVAAAVVLAPSANTTIEDLRQFAAERLARFKRPRRIVSLETLPRGPSEKVLRPVLARLVAQMRPAPTPARTDLEHRILEVWRRLLRREDIGIEDDFLEAGGDSLLAVEMFLEIERIAGRPVPRTDLDVTLTVTGLAQVLGCPVPALLSWTSLVREGSGDPLFFCDGSFARDRSYVFELANHASLDRPIYVIHAPRTLEDRWASMEELADDCLREMCAVRPDGPLVLGGYCNGGLLAWELTRRLEQQGRDVRGLILVETVSLNARWALRTWQRLVATAVTALPAERRRQARVAAMTTAWAASRAWLLLLRRPERALGWAIRQIVGRHRAKSRLAESAPDGGPLTGGAYVDSLQREIFSRMVDYRPSRLSTDVWCLLAPANVDQERFAPRPWRTFANSVRWSWLQGDHDSCVMVHTATLGEGLAESLASLRRSAR
jgi:oxalate---CoA ligase